MLLTQKSHTIQYLPRSSPCGLEAALEIGILLFQPVYSLGIDSRASGRRIDCLHTRFCLKCAASECRKLIAKMSNELVQLFECFDVRTFAGGCQVPPLDP